MKVSVRQDDDFSTEEILSKMATFRKQLLRKGQVSAFIEACQALLHLLESKAKDPRKHAMLRHMLVRELVLHLVRLDQWMEAHAMLMKYLDELIYLPFMSWKRRIKRQHARDNNSTDVRLHAASKLRQADQSDCCTNEREGTMPPEVKDAIEQVKTLTRSVGKIGTLHDHSREMR